MGDKFVVNCRKIIGAAANYKELLKILNRPYPKEPDMFLKPLTSLIVEPQKIQLPKGLVVNEEIELGVIIGKPGKHIQEKDAMGHVAGYCAVLDMTAMSLLSEARKKGGSWTMSKGFDTACPVSRFISKTEIPDPHNVNLWLKVNGKVRQKGNTNDLLFNVPALISHISKYMTLEPNDLILSGSPPGMDAVFHGDQIEAGIEGIVTMKFEVVDE